MSIIYDALNKVVNKHIYNKHSPKSNKLFIIVGITVLIAVLIFSGVLFKEKVHISRKNRHKRTARRPVKFVEKKYTSGSFVLEGIIYEKGIPTAIINGKVLKEGDKISGLKVNKIRKDSVQLFDYQDDKEITISF